MAQPVHGQLCPSTDRDEILVAAPSPTDLVVAIGLKSVENWRFVTFDREAAFDPAGKVGRFGLASLSPDFDGEVAEASEEHLVVTRAVRQAPDQVDGGKGRREDPEDLRLVNGGAASE